MSSFLASAPAIIGANRKLNASSSSGASLSELIAPPLKNSSKRQTNAAESAAIDALFDDGPKQKDTSATAKVSKWKGRPGVGASTSDPFKTGRIDDDSPPTRGVLKTSSSALSLLSSQHSATPKADKDAVPSRPSSSYGLRTQQSAESLGLDFGKESGRSRPRVTFAEPVKVALAGGSDSLDSPTAASWRGQPTIGQSERNGDLDGGVRKTGGLSEGPGSFGMDGDSLDLLGFDSKAGGAKPGRRGRPPTPDVSTTGRPQSGGIATSFGAPMRDDLGNLQTEGEKALSVPRKQGKSDKVDWGNADDLLAMLPDGSAGASETRRNKPEEDRSPIPQARSNFALDTEQDQLQKVGAVTKEPSIAEVWGSLEAASTETDLGGYTPSFLGNPGRRRTGLGPGRRPLISEATIRTDSEGPKRPMSADQARVVNRNSANSTMLGGTVEIRPTTADTFRGGEVPREVRTAAQDRTLVLDSALRPEARAFAGVNGVGVEGIQRNSSAQSSDSGNDAPFLRATEGRFAESSGRRNEEQPVKLVSRGVFPAGWEGAGQASQQMQAEHARALERLREELAASAAKAAREKELLLALHQQELAARDRQAEQEKAFSSEHQKSLEVLQKLVAQVEAWSAEVQQMSLGSRLEKERTVAERAEAVKRNEASLALRESALNAREQQHQSVTQQLEALMATLDENVKELRGSQAEERGRLEKEHARLQALQDSVLAERSAAQADLATARERLEEMRDARLREREAFLGECEAERKALSAERKELADAKEQVCLAEAELDVRIAQHEAKVKIETEALDRERAELEGVRECALEEAHSIQRERMELEEEKAALGAEVDSVQEAARHAQAQLDEAVAIRNEAALLHRDAEALHQDRVNRDARWETERLEIEKAREGLLELRRSLDEERYQLAQERRAAGDEKLAAVRMAESARLLMQKAGGTEPRERKENVPSDRPSPASRKKKRYAGLVKNLVGGRSTLDDVLAARSGASSGDPWLKEREQGRAYLQSQAEFLARAEAHAHSRSFARFGLSRDCNLQVPTRARGETAGPRKGYEGSGPGNWEPGHPEWTSRWEVGGVRIGARSRSEQGGSDGEVIKRSVVEISQFADRVSCERGVHFGESEKEPRAFADKGGDLVGGEATEVWMDSESAERSNVSVTGE